MKEVTVGVGPGARKRQRFQGVLLAEWNRSTSGGGHERYVAWCVALTLLGWLLARAAYRRPRA